MDLDKFCVGFLIIKRCLSLELVIKFQIRFLFPRWLMLIKKLCMTLTFLFPGTQCSKANNNQTEILRTFGRGHETEYEVGPTQQD